MSNFIIEQHKTCWNTFGNRFIMELVEELAQYLKRTQPNSNNSNNEVKTPQPNTPHEYKVSRKEKEMRGISRGPHHGQSIYLSSCYSNPFSS